MTFEIGFHEEEDSRKFPTTSIGYFRLANSGNRSPSSDDMADLKSRVESRLEALGINAFEAARRMPAGRDYVNDILNGKKASVRGVKLEDLARALECDPGYLLGTGGESQREELIRIIGSVGANPDDSILLADGDQGWDLAPIPIGGTPRAVGLWVRGHSMRGLADDGALVFFEQQETPPTPDMLGHVVVVETDQRQVLVKRLLKGSTKGVYDLEGIVGPRVENARLRWAAHIISIVPPYQARRIIRHVAA